jgi:hypothetical protein
MPPKDREERGLRSPLEPPSHTPPVPTNQADHENATAKSDAWRPPPNIEAILITLWHCADPVWLDLTVLTLRHGVNLAFGGDSGPGGATQDGAAPRNMFNPKDKSQFELIKEAIDKDISRGDATAFSAQQPYTFLRLIAAGVVPKKDSDEWRFIHDYSELKSLSSINALSPKIKTQWITWDSVVERFNQGRGGLISTWDCSGAYQLFAIRMCDRHLAVSHIPGLGYTVRTRGDMGNARSGYMFEICGGRLMSTLYAVMSHFTTVDSDGRVQMQLPSFPPDVIAEGRSATPPPGGWADCTSMEIMLSASAREHLASPSMQRLLTRPDGINLTTVSRWCDDFFNPDSDPARARRNDCAVVHFHCLFGLALSPKKFKPADDGRTFYGVDWNARDGTATLDQSKVERFQEALDRHRAGKKSSLREWHRVTGLAVFFARVFPMLKCFLPPLTKLTHQGKHVANNPSNAHVSLDTPTLCPTDKAWTSITAFTGFIATDQRTSVMQLLSGDRMARQAAVVAHTDWSATPAPGRIAVVIPSHGLAAHGAMSPIYYRAERSEPRSIASAVGEATAVIGFLFTFNFIIRDRVVVVFSDNEPLVNRFYKSTSASSAALDLRLCDIAALLATHNARLLLLFVPGSLCLADHLTRTPDQAALAESLLEWNISPPPSPTNLRLPTTPPSLVKRPNSSHHPGKRPRSSPTAPANDSSSATAKRRAKPSRTPLPPPQTN